MDFLTVFILGLIAFGYAMFHIITDGEITKVILRFIVSILRFIVSQFVKKTKSQSTRNEMSNEPSKFGIGVGGVLIILFSIAIFVWMTMVTVVPAGYVGVKDTFGSVEKDVLPSGIHLKSPFTSIHPMSIQTQKYMDYGSADVATIQGLSNEGLAVSMGIAVNYHLDPSKASDVYKSVGEKYENVILVNPIHSVPRDVIAQYDAKTLYSASAPGSADRVKVESQLFEGISASVNKVGVKDAVAIEQVYIRNIDLPQQLKDAISNKLTAEQQIQQKEFDVKKQEKEADRMRAEAQGIADANKIIADSLSPSYLEWYTIEMMTKHTGATYFIPIDSNGRVNPNIVIPVAGDTKI
jgi:prohibitin 1